MDRRGKGKFFRIKMGLKGLGGKGPNYKLLTPLNIEMRICANFLHIPHSVFSNFSREEKIKWFLFEEMERKREDFFNKEQIEHINHIKNKGTK